MITEWIIEVILYLLAIFLAPVNYLIERVFGDINPLLSTFFAYVKMGLSWASAFVSPSVLRVAILFVPGIVTLRVSVKFVQWIIRLIRG